MDGNARPKPELKGLPAVLPSVVSVTQGASSVAGVKTIPDLIYHAESIGLTIEWGDVGGFSGVLVAGGVAVINPHLGEMAQRVAIAHECGHFWYGHDWRSGHDLGRDERQADRYAAGLLVEPDELFAAAQLYDGLVGAVARELGVPERLLLLAVSRLDFPKHWSARL